MMKYMGLPSTTRLADVQYLFKTEAKKAVEADCKSKLVKAESGILMGLNMQ